MPIKLFRVVATAFHLFRLTTPRFRQLLERLHQFVSLRLFPGQSDELPPMCNCGWWIPSAVKVLSLLSKLVLGEKLFFVSPSLIQRIV